MLAQAIILGKYSTNLCSYKDNSIKYFANIADFYSIFIVLIYISKIVKEEVNTIWGDYFKESQLEKFPETHKIVHLIMQLASKCKQEGSVENAEKLLEQLNRFAEIFWASKGVRTERVTSPYPPAKKMIIPVLFGD